MNMEHYLQCRLLNSEISEYHITVEEDCYWFILNPENEREAMHFKSIDGELKFEWVPIYQGSWAADDESPSPACLSYVDAMKAVRHFGIGILAKVDLICSPMSWSIADFQIAPDGLEGLYYAQVFLPDSDTAIAEAWFVEGNKIFLDLKILDPAAKDFELGDRLECYDREKDSGYVIKPE